MFTLASVPLPLLSLHTLQAAISVARVFSFMPFDDVSRLSVRNANLPLCSLCCAANAFWKGCTGASFEGEGGARLREAREVVGEGLGEAKGGLIMIGPDWSSGAMLSMALLSRMLMRLN
jgi:hypothetical protein